jgi:uncharacterized protein YndB with AHSA1/START domain
MADSRKPFILTRTFDAPRQLVWDTFTKAEHLKHGMGPAGTKMDHVKVDLRPGGVFHYGMKMPDGNTMWGKWTFREIDPPKKLVVVVSFSDENLGVTRHPRSAMAPVRCWRRKPSVSRSCYRRTKKHSCRSYGVFWKSRAMER